MLSVGSKVESGGMGQDRVGVVRLELGLLLALSDGAGGWGDGARAAERVVQALTTSAGRPDVVWAEVLSALDADLARAGIGEATAIVIEVSASGLRGASIGDSAAFLVHDGRLDELTRDQRRKPLLGSGAARAVSFERLDWQGRLLLVSDGIDKYVARAELGRLALRESIAESIDAIVSSARLPSGALHDDVSIVLCERAGAS